MIDSVSAESSGSIFSDAPFSFSTRLGIVFIAEAACLSLLSVAGLLVYMSLFAGVHNGQRHWSLSTPLHAYFISMMVSELIQATGSIMDIKWVADSRVTNGSFCVVQGILKQIGDIAVALSTLAIAAHTFCAIVLSWRPLRPRIISTLVLTSIWSTIIVIIVITIVTHKDNLTGYWGSTEYWCWITTRYEVQQYALDYVFMWTTAFANIILYIPLSLVIKGIITVSRFKLRFRSKGERLHILATQSNYHGNSRSVDGIAMQMLFYPMVYTLTVLPIAIVRFRAFNNQYVPFVYTVIADVLFSCSGFFNVCLFRLTRPALLPRRESASTYPSPNAISFSLRSPVVDHHSSFIGRPSFVPERSQLGALPDDSEIYRFESRSYPDHDVHSLEASPTKLSPSFASFRSHA